MNIFMTGGTGFVGTFLAKKFISEGHKVTILTHTPGEAAQKITGLSYLEANPTVKGPWQDAGRNHQSGGSFHIQSLDTCTKGDSAVKQH